MVSVAEADPPLLTGERHGVSSAEIGSRFWAMNAARPVTEGR